LAALPVAESALHEVYVQRGAKIETRGAWQVPVQYGSVDVEVNAARSAVAVSERCGGGVIEVVGAALADLATRLGVGEVPAGAASIVTLSGVGEARWCRLARDQARILVGPGEVDMALADLAQSEICLHLTDVSSGLTTLVLIGPRSPDLLARLVRVDVDPRALADRYLALTGAVGIPLQLLRWDRPPLLAYELTVGRDVAVYFWEALLHAGEDLGLKPIGEEAGKVLGAGP
jgi:glycine cleavage system aminomethyltransferase T